MWALDHLFWPHPIDEAMTTLTVAAIATRRPMLGTCVLQLPLRQPPAVAKQATAIQLLSGGRFVLGLGVGSHEGEYVRAGVDYHRRGELMDAGIASLRQAWASADDPQAAYRQEPAAPRIPIWIGGSSEAARHRAATVADGWVPLFLTADEYGPALQELRREIEAAGRPADDVEAAVVVFARVGDRDEATESGCRWLSELYGIPAKAFERHLVSGTAGDVADRVAAYRDAGAEHVALYVTDDRPLHQFEALVGALSAAGVPAAV